MHQYIRFLNDIANNSHHYFSVFHHASSSHYTLVFGAIIGVVLVIIGIVILFIGNINVALIVGTIGAYTFILSSIAAIYTVPTIEVVSHINSSEINRYVNQAHQEYPYVVTVKTEENGFLHHRTIIQHYLVASINHDELHNVIKIHKVDHDNGKTSFLIKNYIGSIGGSYTDSRTYLKHKVKQDIENEKDNLSE